MVTAFILTVFISLSISAICSILEACLLSFTPTDIARLSEKKPYLANVWKELKANIQKPIAVVLIVNTFSHTIGAALSGVQWTTMFGPKWVALYSFVFSVVMIQWTEILPKTLGVKYNNFFAPLIAVPLNILIRAFSPFLTLIQWLNRPFEGKKTKQSQMDTLNDIQVLTRFASLQNLISHEQKNIVEKSIELSKKTVSDIMIKKEEVKCLSTKMKLSDALVEAHIHHHTRFPLIEVDDPGNIIGYVNFKDIVSALQLNPQNPTLRGISRPIISVEDTQTLPTLLNKLIKSYQHIAVVKDRSGSVVGLVTLENVMEALVGEIYDEYDVLPTYVYKIAENRFVVGAGISMEALAKDIGIEIEDPQITLSDWLMKKFEKKPRAEDMIEFKKTKFIVRKVSRSKIYETILEKSI